MSHTLTIAEENKHSILSKMHSYDSNAYVENFTSPRMTNRQLKYFFSRLQRSIMTTILNKLQQVYKSSKGCDKWLAAFIVVLGMSMAHEDQQKTIHQTMATKATTEHLDMRDAQARAEIACREIDARMGFIAHIFRLKYNRKCNPLRDADHDWEREVGFGDASSVTFVRQVAQLVKENSKSTIIDCSTQPFGYVLTAMQSVICKYDRASVFRPKIKRSIRHDLSVSSCYHFGSQHEPKLSFVLLRSFERLDNPHRFLFTSSSSLVFHISTPYT
jgi:hypothetical protein